MDAVNETALAFCDEAKALEIKDEASWNYASVLLGNLKDLRKAITDTFKPIKQQQDKAKRETLAQEKKALEPVERAEAMLRPKVAEYYRQKKQAAEVELKKVGVESTATVASPAGVSFRPTYKYEITDPEKLPREYLIPDAKKIGKEVRETKGACKIPGVKTWEESSTVVK